MRHESGGVESLGDDIPDMRLELRVMVTLCWLFRSSVEIIPRVPTMLCTVVLYFGGVVTCGMKGKYS